MSKKITIILAAALTVVVLFSACSRSVLPLTLSTPTAKGAVSTSQSSESKPSATPTGMNLIQSWGTTTAAYVQTAVAQGTLTSVPATATPLPPTATSILPATGVAATNTPVPVVATNTPMPGTTPVVIVPTATAGRPATYVLNLGEFPYCIARRFNVDPDDLLSLNGLSSGQIVQPGLTLNIPQSGAFPGNRALAPHPAQYSVKVGDTLHGVACKFGDVDPSAIAAANNLSISSPLVTGTILNIP